MMFLNYMAIKHSHAVLQSQNAGNSSFSECLASEKALVTFT